LNFALRNVDGQDSGFMSNAFLASVLGAGERLVSRFFFLPSGNEPPCEGVWVLEDVMLVPEHVVWGPGLVWVLEDVMLVPGHVVWGPGLVWVLQQIGAVPKKKSVSSRGFKRPFSGRAAHPAAIFLQSASAHRNDVSFSTVYSQFVSFCH